MTAETEVWSRRRTKREQHRYNGNSAAAKRIRVLAAEFTAKIGKRADDPIVRLQIGKAAELTTLAEVARARAIRGEPIGLHVLSRLQAEADRAVRLMFAIPEAKHEPVAETLAEYLARADREAEAEAAAAGYERGLVPGSGIAGKPQTPPSGPRCPGKRPSRKNGGKKPGVPGALGGSGRLVTPGHRSGAGG